MRCCSGLKSWREDIWRRWWLRGMMVCFRLMEEQKNVFKHQHKIWWWKKVNSRIHLIIWKAFLKPVLKAFCENEFVIGACSAEMKNPLEQSGQGVSEGQVFWANSQGQQVSPRQNRCVSVWRLMAFTSQIWGICNFYQLIPDIQLHIVLPYISLKYISKGWQS